MPAGRNATVCGLYLDFNALRDCVEKLEAAGVRATDMSLVLPNGSLTSAFPLPRDPQRLAAVCKCGSARETANVACDAAGVPMAGALTKTLLMIGIPVYDSERLESKVRNGGILLWIRCDESLAHQVRSLLIETEAQDSSLGRDAKEFERCSLPRKAPYGAFAANKWEQRSAHV